MPFRRKPKAPTEEERIRPHLDPHFYLERYPDVAALGIDPVKHYLASGAREGRDPTPWFSTFGYLNAHHDVKSSGTNPFLHYIEYGREEGRLLSWNDPDEKSVRAPFVPPEKVDAAERMKRYLCWLHCEDRIPASEDQLNSCIRELVERHIATGDPLVPDGDMQGLALHMEVVRDRFDEAAYVASIADDLDPNADPLVHYCAKGWRALENPAALIDIAWYWRAHLNPAAAVVDPLLHYSLFGEENGLPPRHPHPISLGKSGAHLPMGTTARRACLFAGHDPQSRIDNCVLHYLKQLSRFADVYYLTSNEMSDEELSRLDGITKDTWSAPHRGGAAGSHARLFEQFVGWNTLQGYDEIILADDHAFLVGDLAPVFARMETIAADWWGLEATYGGPRTRRIDTDRFEAPISIKEIGTSLLQAFEDENGYRFAVGHGFTVLRRPIITDPGFKRFVQSHSEDEPNQAPGLRYAPQLTQLLVQAGYRFACFMDELSSINPTLSELAFEWIAKGYPLLRRPLLVNNPYFSSGLETWPQRLLSAAPQADPNIISRSLAKYASPLDLQIAWQTSHDEQFNPIKPNLLSAQEIAERDLVVPKRDDWWVFPVCAYDHNLSGNDRVVFEAVRNDPAIRKIILTRDKPVTLEGPNVYAIPLMSREGQEALLHSRVVFIKHVPHVNVVFPLTAQQRLFICLWHGIPFKRIGTASLDTSDQREALLNEHAKLSSVIASSPIDQLAMAAGFQPLEIEDVWITGLPRHDWILREIAELPEDLQDAEETLRSQIAGKRLILFCPTFRNDADQPGYRMSANEIAQLETWLNANNAVLGIREHMADDQQTYSALLTGPAFLHLPSSVYPHIEALYRASDALITDYSSCFFDYMLTSKPAISFAHDLENYRDRERGTFYDIDTVFPGPVCRTFADLMERLDDVAAQNFVCTDQSLDLKRRLFFAFHDGSNAKRVVERVRRQLEISHNAIVS